MLLVFFSPRERERERELALRPPAGEKKRSWNREGVVQLKSRRWYVMKPCASFEYHGGASTEDSGGQKCFQRFELKTIY